MTIDMGEWLEKWLSVPRFGVYLAAAGDDRKLALKLYAWNATVSAAWHCDLGHLEVGLRNAYDRALTAVTGDRAVHWVFDAQRLFPPVWQRAANGTRYDANKTTRRLIGDAIKEASSAHSSLPPPGKVIAELSFGFWRYLSVRRHDQCLWVPYLHHAFAPGVSRRAVDEPIERLHRLRNRVAHHEPLLTTHLQDRHEDLLRVAGLISPQLRSYIAATSQCPRLMSERPVGG